MTNKQLLVQQIFRSFWRSRFGSKVSNTAVFNDLRDTHYISDEFSKSFKGNFIESNANVLGKDVTV